MLAYNKITLYNLHVREEAEEALRSKSITAEEYKLITERHPVDLYTPNLFVRIGLGFLTIFIVLFSVGLMILFFDVGSSSFSVLLTASGIICYGMLELMATTKKHFNSGVDNILSIAVVVLVMSGVSAQLFLTNSFSETVLSFCTFIICLWLATRFVSSLMAIVAFVSLMCFLFYGYTRLGGMAEITFPFVLILASSIIYYSASHVKHRSSVIYYGSVLTALKIVALLSLYISSNFYFVNELTLQRFTVVLPSYMIWFCWMWTMAIPLLYVIAGVRNKNIIMARTGAVLIPVAIVTFRYYHAILSAEAAMTLAGVILIAVSYLLIRYLRNPKYGYTFEVQKRQSDLKNLEGFIIGEAFGSKTSHQQDNKFGGGSFGGAGAGDTY